ncbi:unnamed protein product [Rotaria magnacalcarata]|nr:unnamed protein product [Rotaria magnacalcarata]
MYNANEGAALSLPQLPKVYDCYLSLHQWRGLIASNDASMNCFENRDFEDLKVSLRKMPNSQATGEELGRRISCTWDMKAFDISSLWSLNAVIQLTQDLTRIHNVDEHASLVRRTSNCVPTTINSKWTALRMGATRLTRQQNNFTLASKLLIQQF